MPPIGRHILFCLWFLILSITWPLDCPAIDHYTVLIKRKGQHIFTREQWISLPHMSERQSYLLWLLQPHYKIRGDIQSEKALQSVSVNHTVWCWYREISGMVRNFPSWKTEPWCRHIFHLPLMTIRDLYLLLSFMIIRKNA